MSKIINTQSVLTPEQQTFANELEEWINTDECSAKGYNLAYPVICMIEQLCWQIKKLQAQVDGTIPTQRPISDFGDPLDNENEAF